MNKIIKPFLNDIFRERNTKAITDHEWDIKALRLKNILQLKGKYRTPDGLLSRKEALLREVGEIISDPEEKVNQLLLMYKSYKN